MPLECVRIQVDALCGLSMSLALLNIQTLAHFSQGKHLLNNNSDNKYLISNQESNQTTNGMH